MYVSACLCRWVCVGTHVCPYVEAREQLRCRCSGLSLCVFHWPGAGQLASGLCLPPLPSAEVTNVPPHDSGPHVRYTNFTNGTTFSALWVGFSFVCFLIECCFHCTIFSRILIIEMTKSLTSRNF